MPDLAITYSVVDAVAPSLYEIWLKETGGPCALFQVGDAETVAPTHAFTRAGLAPLTEYSVQPRMSQDGRYREAYSSADPDSWPVGSLLTFTTGGP